MNIAIVHLSDVHMKDSEHNQCNDLLPKIAAAIHQHCVSANCIVIVVTGDLAFSGKQSEYQLFGSFLERLQRQIEADLGQIPMFVSSPGNHDCDFALDDGARKGLIANIATTEIDSSVVRVADRIQDAYTSFTSGVLTQPDISWSQPLQKTHGFNLNGTKITFVVYNTAWMSEKNEKRGTLRMYLPADEDMAALISASNIVVSLLHHPFGWFTQADARLFQRHIQRTSDLVLTGHEHEPGAYLRDDLQRSCTSYIEGGPLQGHGENPLSAFNIINLCTDEESYKVTQLDYNGLIYVPVAVLGPKPFIRNAARLTNTFLPQPIFLDHLADMEVVFRHPHKAVIEIDDLFVQPPLRHLDLTSKNKLAQLFRGTVPDIAKDHPYIYVAGPEKSGKTVLAKTTFKQFHETGIIPLIAKGRQFTNPRSAAMEHIIEKLIEEQYGILSRDTYLQLSKSTRAIIIDDYHETKLRGKHRDTLLCELTRRFGFVVLFGSDDARLDELFFASQQQEESEGSECIPAIMSFDHYEIAPLNVALRSDLVTKWMLLGITAFEQDEEAIYRKKIRAENILTSIIGKNLLPSFPLFILMILQQVETTDRLSTNAGAHGHLHESLITLNLAQTSSYEVDIDIKKNYLAALSYAVLGRPDHELTLEEMKQWHDAYCEDQLLDLDLRRLTAELLAARILRQRGNEIVFSYPYMRYFFTARYFSGHLDNDMVQKAVRGMCGQLYRNEAANIMMFMAYLCKDRFILDAMLEQAAVLFTEFDEIDLDKPPSFIAALERQPPKMILTNANPEKNRRAELERNDTTYESVVDEEASDDETNLINEVNRLNASVKTIQVLGQVLRSYPGDLSGPDKLQLAGSCYGLGLRTLGFMLNMVDRYGKDLVEHIVDITLRLHPEASRVTLEKEANGFLYNLCERMGFGIIKHVSGSVGLEELGPVFKRLREKTVNESYDVIELSIRLDHFHGFPKTEAVELYERHKGNLYTGDIVRHLVWHHLHMFPVDLRVRQHVCQKLGIEQNLVTIVGTRKLVSDK